MHAAVKKTIFLFMFSSIFVSIFASIKKPLYGIFLLNPKYGNSTKLNCQQEFIGIARQTHEKKMTEAIMPE
jgi:hypothetical protein